MYAKKNEHNHYCQEFLDPINSSNWDIFKTQNGGGGERQIQTAQLIK